MMSISSDVDRRLAQDLVELARRDAINAEERGRLDDEFIERFREIGAWAAPIGRDGLQPTLFEMLDLIRVVATGDGSAGWVAMIYLTSSVAGHWLPPEGRAEVFAGGVHSLIAGVLAPRGNARSESGGYRLSGKWPFGSGSAHADWMGLGAVIDAIPERTGVFFVPRDEIEIVPTWSVLGLRATSSDDQSVSEVFVPQHRVAYLDGPNLTAEPVARFPILGLLAAGIGAVSIGIAQATIAEFSELAGAKTPTGSKRRLADRARVQEAVSRAHAGVESAWYYLAHRSTSVSDVANQSDRVRLRQAATAAVEVSRAIVGDLFNLAGGSSIYERSPLQKQLRDIETASQHMMVGQPTWELTGRVLLGIDSDPPGL
jgi:alkylation response protein AidB-like acyl-CoA dehydrogenase